MYIMARPANVKWASGVSPGHSRNHDAKHWQQAHRNEAGMLWSYLRPGRVTKSILFCLPLSFPSIKIHYLELHSSVSFWVWQLAKYFWVWFVWRANQWPSIVENNVLFYSCQQLNLSRSQTIKGFLSWHDAEQGSLNHALYIASGITEIQGHH